MPKAGQPAAKQNDQVVGTDTHVLMVPSPGGPVPTPTPMPFTGVLDGELSGDVVCESLPIATKGSTATNTPSHLPTAGPFQKPPANKGTIDEGSATVFANGKAVARAGDKAMTCNDPGDAPQGTVVATSTVLVG